MAHDVAHIGNTGAQMKTTIDLPDDLLERGKETARRENSTLKALIEEGLRMALRARAQAQRDICGSALPG